MRQQSFVKTGFIALSVILTATAIGATRWSSHSSGVQSASSPPQPISVLAPLANSMQPYEQQIQPVEGWEMVRVYQGSGAQSFCPSSNLFAVSAPWRLRWRVGQISDSAHGSGYVMIKVVDKANAGAFRRVESNTDLSEFSSEVFTVTGNAFCILAKSSSTEYNIWVEQQVNRQAFNP